MPSREAGMVTILGRVRWWRCGHFYVKAGPSSGWSGRRGYNIVKGMEFCPRLRWHRGSHGEPSTKENPTG